MKVGGFVCAMWLYMCVLLCFRNEFELFRFVEHFTSRFLFGQMVLELAYPSGQVVKKCFCRNLVKYDEKHE